MRNNFTTAPSQSQDANRFVAYLSQACSRGALFVAAMLCLLFSGMAAHAQTFPTPQPLTYSQNFGTTTFTTMPAGTAALNGLNGGNVTTQALAEATVPTGNATVAAATVATTTGGSFGFATSSNARYYVQTSSNATNGVNQLAAAINTTNFTNIVVNYNVEIISAQPRTVGVVMQYRVGATGAWTTLTGTGNPYSQAGGTTGIKASPSLTLPAAANNQSVVQLRWATWRGTETGNSSGLAIDDIVVSGTAVSSSGPTVTSFTPTNGTVGTPVTITGAGFTGATVVSFNGTAATTFSVDSDTQITATVPAGATTGSISVTTAAGTGTSSGTFTVNAPAITSFTPTSGAVGTTVVITGTFFTGATAVTFNGTAATPFSVDSDTQITTTVPTGATTGTIKVTTPSGTGTSATSFTVLTAPSITSFTPTSGPVNTVVTITGTGFVGTTTVKFNGTSAPFIIDSATQIRAAVPVGATTGTISVTNGLGTATGGSFTVTNVLPFTAGNLVIERAGDGSAALSTNAFQIFLDEYTTAGALVQSIPLPAFTQGTNKRVTDSGTGTSGGLLTRSVDGNYLTLPGYDAALGTATVASAAGDRVVGVIGTNGAINSATSLTDAYSSNTFRSVVTTDGTNLYLGGTGSATTGGVRYTTTGATTSTQLSTDVVNVRQVNIFAGQLYTSSASGAFRLATVGTGTPTTAGQTITNLPGFPTATGSPYGFFFADLNAGVAGVDTVYVADDVAGVQKYSLVGGSWALNGTITSTVGGVRGITGTVSGGNVTLFVTGSTGATGTLYTVMDTAGYNAAPSTTTLATVTTAGTNMAFRGVAFTPGVASTSATTGALLGEFRAHGSGGATDEYIELANSTTSPLSIGGWSVKYLSGGTLVTATVPANTTLVPLGHYLFTGSGYNVTLSGISGSDQTLASAMDDATGITLLNAASTVVDAVSFAGSSMAGEGTLLPSAPTADGEYAFERRQSSGNPAGVPLDNNNNSGDFIFVSTTGATFASVTGAGATTTLISTLGAPSPNSTTGYVQVGSVAMSLLDTSVANTASPNRVRLNAVDSGVVGAPDRFGTLRLRRTLTNNGSTTYTRVRFHVVTITTYSAGGAGGYSDPTQADVRLLTSPDETGAGAITTSTGAKNVIGTSVQAPATLSVGGGLNANTVVLNQALTPGSSANYSFELGVARKGNFLVGFTIELLP